MMGSSHALSGAAVWLGSTWALSQFADYHQTPIQIAVGTAVCAGGALLPDLDLSGRVTSGQGGATVAHTFGRVSLFMAEVIEKFSHVIYSATRMRHDPHRHNGHRTLTHTIPFTVGVGWLTTWACWRGGKWAVLGILFFMLGLALRGLLGRGAERFGWIFITLVSAAAAYFTYLYLPPDRGYPMLGVAVGVGCFVHLMGDVVTSAGVPLLWPLPTGGGRMWRMFGVPNFLSVRVGGKVETVLLRGVFAIVCLAAAAALAGPGFLARFNINV